MKINIFLSLTTAINQSLKYFNAFDVLPLINLVIDKNLSKNEPSLLFQYSA
jgi:hypothetical protein